MLQELDELQTDIEVYCAEQTTDLYQTHHLLEVLNIIDSHMFNCYVTMGRNDDLVAMLTLQGDDSTPVGSVYINWGEPFIDVARVEFTVS